MQYLKKKIVVTAFAFYCDTKRSDILRGPNHVRKANKQENKKKLTSKSKRSSAVETDGVRIPIMYGTIIRTGITCKKIPRYSHDSASRWFIVSKS